MVVAALRFMRGLLKLPLAIQLWLVVLILFNMVLPLAFWGQVEARIAFGTILVAALLMVVITWRVGFTRLLGLGHFVWYPLLYYLWTRLPAHPADQPFGLYLRVLMVLNGISLVLDVADVLRYIYGDRAELVSFQ